MQLCYVINKHQHEKAYNSGDIGDTIAPFYDGKLTLRFELHNAMLPSAHFKAISNEL